MALPKAGLEVVTHDSKPRPKSRRLLNPAGAGSTLKNRSFKYKGLKVSTKTEGFNVVTFVTFE
jgi:hypothetical protein